MDTLKNLVGKDLMLREDLLAEVSSEEALLELIKIYVQELIDQDFEKLLHLLYRLDVQEAKVKAVIDGNGPANAALSIAHLKKCIP